MKQIVPQEIIEKKMFLIRGQRVLNDEEGDWLVSQNVIPHRKYFGGSLPFAFIEEGIAMLSTVLKSERATQMNIAIMRANDLSFN